MLYWFMIQSSSRWPVGRKRGWWTGHPRKNLSVRRLLPFAMKGWRRHLAAFPVKLSFRFADDVVLRVVFASRWSQLLCRQIRIMGCLQKLEHAACASSWRPWPIDYDHRAWSLHRGRHEGAAHLEKPSRKTFKSWLRKLQWRAPYI